MPSSVLRGALSSDTQRYLLTMFSSLKARRPFKCLSEMRSVPLTSMA